MFAPGLTAADQLARLGAVLGLEHDGEDWGVVNADGARLVELVDFFLEHHDRRWKTPCVVEYLDLDLDLESACDVVRAGGPLPVEPLGRFMSTVAPLVGPEPIASWKGPNRAVAPYLRRLGW